MVSHNWEAAAVVDGRTPNTAPPEKADADPSPAYEDVVAGPSRSSNAQPRLRILGATWGGVNVTAEISGMVGDDETISFNMHTLLLTLQPDPAPGIIKTLTVLYLYEDQGEIRLLNVPEFIPSISVKITPTTHKEKVVCAQPTYFSTLSDPAWTDGADGQVEIIAVLYGTKRIKNPSALQELARFFEGRRGQIRTTTAFFGTDPWIGFRKSWTVYFRFASSRRIHCVTGMQDGALEVPWTRS